MGNQKEATTLMLEDSYATAALFSLCGANTIVLNQWANSFQGNRRLILGMFSSMKDKKLDVAESLAAVLRPDEALPGSRPGTGSSKSKGKKNVAADEPPPLPLKARVKYCTAVYGLANMKLVCAFRTHNKVSNCSS